MIGACCLSKNTLGKQTCIQVSPEVCEIYNGYFMGERSQCPQSGFCNVSDDGVIDSCNWCCGCSKDTIAYWPCCFHDNDGDGICDCVESYENSYYGKCSGTGRGDCNIEGQNSNYIQPGYLLKEKEEPETCYVDTRIPRACCFMLYNEFNIPLGITCQNVCNSTECDGKNLAFPTKNPSVYSSGAFCNKQMTTEQTSPYDCTPEAFTILGGFKKNLTYKNKETGLRRNGVCFNLKKTLDNKYSYECNTSTVSNCRGYFVSVYDTGIENICSSDYSPATPVFSDEGILQTESMDLNKFINLKLSFGDYFRGANYIGIYSPRTSDVYGSDLKDLRKRPDIFRSSKDIKGSESKSWALFVENKEIETTLFTQEEIYKSMESTSMHDGFYNTYGSGYEYSGMDSATINTIKKFNRRGIMGWYVPSLLELAFFARQLVNNSENYYTYATKFTHGIWGHKFTSSTTLNSKLLYSQSFDINNSESFGRISVYNPYKGKIKIRLFRKIDLTY